MAYMIAACEWWYMHIKIVTSKRAKSIISMYFICRRFSNRRNVESRALARLYKTLSPLERWSTKAIGSLEIVIYNHRPPVISISDNVARLAKYRWLQRKFKTFSLSAIPPHAVSSLNRLQVKTIESRVSEQAQEGHDPSRCEGKRSWS